MRKKEKLTVMECMAIDCVSYTVVSLTLSVLDAFAGGMTIYYGNILELFCCTTVICAGMYGIGLIPLRSGRTRILLQLLDVAAVILGIGGGVFAWFPWTWDVVLFVVCIFVFVYFITYGVILLQNKLVSDRINLILKEKRDGKGH